MSGLFILIGAISALTSIALGAFAAHAIQDQLTVANLAIYATANDYHMMHSLALLLIALLLPHATSPALITRAGLTLLVGMLIFSGSLYLLALLDLRWLGAITPIGGVLLMIGWAILAFAGWQQLRQDRDD
ncbi:MAG TPA: DUF423 domain-containing protein [Chromatiales bacterium]|jgi:uncharacterized membrane protein YgdD (TMEM256/DUF423 family)|nr:DUF423 domain-containing protein [Chromatiales bacterium]